MKEWEEAILNISGIEKAVFYKTLLVLGLV
jgi:hypothetical protein